MVEGVPYNLWDLDENTDGNRFMFNDQAARVSTSEYFGIHIVGTIFNLLNMSLILDMSNILFDNISKAYFIMLLDG